MFHVLVVEDSKITREAIVRQLESSPNYLVIANIENAANAELICMRKQVDLILMDICTADDESGLKAAGKIKKYFPEIRIIIMTSMPEYSFLQKARDCGCSSFWYKEYGDEDLLDLCDRTMAGEEIWPEETPSIPVGCASSRDFTEKELSIMRELVSGYRYEEIAEHLGITSNTVKYHVKNILQKTGHHSTLQLVADVVERRLILPKY